MEEYKNYKEVCNNYRDCIICPLGKLSFKKGNSDKTCKELFEILKANKEK